MTDFPAYVRYVERLGTPDAAGLLPAIDVEIAQTRDDAFDLVATLDRLMVEDPRLWKAMYRQVTATDWYVLGLLMSGGRKQDPFTGRSWIDHDFQFNFARELQFHGGSRLDKTARGHGKSFWRNYVGITNRILVNQNIVAVIVAHEKQKALNHVILTVGEWENNLELKTGWDDVFYMDPRQQSALWSMEKGYKVRRSIESVLPTLSAFAILEVPTGVRIGLYCFDDIENEQTTETDEMREKTIKRFGSFLQTDDVLPEIWINGTHHHAAGLVSQLEKSGAWRVAGYPAEDVTKEAPDVAALVDECGGKWPDGQEMMPALRDMRLDGAPVFHHPLRLAQKRLAAMALPDGLATYYMQMMCDAHAGQERKLDPARLRWYLEAPEDRARGSVLVATVDGSKGVNDPTFAMMWALHVDQSISLVGALRKKLTPSNFGPALFQFWGAWEGIAQFDHFRVEIFAQAVYDWMITSYFEDRGKWVDVVPIGRNRVENRRREYDAIEPLLKAGRFHFPKGGIIIDDENGRPYNVVEWFVENELKHWPLIVRDDGVASMALLGEPVDPKKRICELPFPEDDEAVMLRERSAGARPEVPAWDRNSWWEGP